MELTWPVVHCISLDVFLKIVCVCGTVHKAMGGGEGWGDLRAGSTKFLKHL